MATTEGSRWSQVCRTKQAITIVITTPQTHSSRGLRIISFSSSSSAARARSGS